MSRTKSTGLIKAATRLRSDAGSAGFRPLRDLPRAVEPKPVKVEAPPDDPVLAAIVAPIEAETREIAAPSKPESPRRRMVQEDLFASLGVKV